MTKTANSRIRPVAKFFFEGDKKFFVKGVTYGPFKPDAEGNYLGSPEQVDSDLVLMRQAGLNVLRVYHAPPRWFLDHCAAAGMHVLVTLPWEKHIEFLRERSMHRQIAEAVRTAVKMHAGHPAILGYLVGNEVSSTMARWLGARRVIEFVEELIRIGRRSIRMRSFPTPRIRQPNICCRKMPIFVVLMFTSTTNKISRVICCDCKISPASIRLSWANSAWTLSGIRRTNRPKCSVGTSIAS